MIESNLAFSSGEAPAAGHGDAGTTILARLPWLSADERAALTEAISVPRTVNANCELVGEGARADGLHLLVDGWACQYRSLRDGQRQMAALILPGEMCNLDGLLLERSDFSVRTLTPATVVTLPRDRALALADAHPGIVRGFTWLALIENAILGQWALGLGRRTARQRLSHLVCELAVRLGAVDGNGARYHLPLTQEQLADALGLTSVHVNRTLQALRGEGLVATRGRAVTVPDMAALALAAEFDPSYIRRAA